MSHSCKRANPPAREEVSRKSLGPVFEVSLRLLARDEKGVKHLLPGKFNHSCARVSGTIVNQDPVFLIDDSGWKDNVGHEARALVVGFGGEVVFLEISASSTS
jgi:hypothetical protein